MTLKINISQNLYCNASGSAELPIDDWNEVKDWYIKWDTLHYTLEDGKWHEVELDSDCTDGTDWKRPKYACIESEDYDEILGEY